MDAVTSLAAYVAAYMLAAVPVARQAPELPEAAMERYEAISRVIADVALDPAERPVFGDPEGRETTAVLIAELGARESGYAADVVAGRRTRRPYVCMLQVNASGGIALLSDGTYAYAAASRPLVDGAVVMYAPQLADDLRTCVRVGLRIAGESWRRTGTIAGFIGETPPGPQSSRLLARVRRWMAAHPLRPV